VVGTEITLQNGEIKNIEEIEIGDFVLSYNEQTKLQEYKKVIKLQRPMHDDLVTYHLSNGKMITSTFDHPFYVNDLKLASYSPELTNTRYDNLIDVQKINVGDILNSQENEEISILSITENERVLTQTYIFTVEDTNNFYANGVLVHNK
jgi:intein/homing endonuclease